ncbi:hypothetical protein Rsub_06133 [Raphidocelis subcapitata]|uniref:Fatty acid hydroxylase domain-containing protein n=1 Tax=Raphidocelis subcapitata TaxID=307507 RepID=A0A2V0P1P5_9CHLO|nr:hypothetical protein Rsub_06133 [Raphidocelis subcapitata]|eukprot:GBF93801.1 hypothetical protein Rsub_06133 [Raphidocelis subcapitata]
MAAASAAAAGLAARWLATPWLVWGVGPMAAVNAGFFLTAALLELLLATRLLDSDLLVYPANGAPAKRRDAALAATQEKIPFSKQLLTCLFIIAGPHAVANGASLTLLMRLAGAPAPAAWWPGDVLSAAWQLLAMAVVADFGLYWGHRVQHESKLLWQVHKVHHRIDTPSPFSTMYIHGLDATLQGGIPMALATLLIRPAPAILYISFGLRVAENALNHSGLDSRLLDFFTLKSLPFRAAAAHHDAHHKYCNHPKNARNYGETFYIWDVMFGTVNPRHGTRQGPPPKRVD